MNTLDISVMGDRFTHRFAVSLDAPCRHFNIEMDGYLWSTIEPEFICTKCRARFSLDQALIVREMNEIRA